MITVFQTKVKATDCLTYPPQGWTDGYVMANGIRIHYWRTGGDKPVMVMAHGSSDNGLCWTNLARELEADYDIILPDARGHGLSDPPTLSDGPDAQCEDLAGLVRALGLKKPIMMGHSMGSSSVVWFAARYPDIPGAVILEDPGLIPRPSGNIRSSASNADVEKERSRILIRNNMSNDELVALCMKNTPQWGQCECEFWAPSKRLHHPNNAYRRLIGRGPEKSELFTLITAPTLILKADAQGEIRKQNEEIAALLKNGKIVHVEGARHNVRRDQKERLLKALREFLGEYNLQSHDACEEEWVDLIRGKDFDGWSFHLTKEGRGNEGTFTIKDGVMVCNGSPSGYMYTEKSYSKFILQLEWAFDRPDTLTDDSKFRGNSGVLIHTGEKNALGVWPRSIEVQGMHNQAGLILPIPRNVECKRTFYKDALARNLKPVGEWNKMKIKVNGGDMVISINGAVISTVSECELTEGPIGFQSEGAGTRWRNIRILE